MTESLDASFESILASLAPSPHQVVLGDEPAGGDSTDPAGPDAQAAGDGVRDPPGQGGGGGTPPPENTYDLCHDAQDNDGDGLVDCADAECFTFCIPEDTYDACTNLVDDNSNGLVDCYDPSCQSMFCTTQKAEAKSVSCSTCCTDRKDNDWDSLIDCADPDCTASDPTACRYWDSGAYEYDGAGNVSAMARSSSLRDTYTYDKVNRLANATLASADGNWMRYTYDDFGNMSRWEKGFSSTVNASRDFTIDTSTNRIASSSLNSSAGAIFRYDAVGNLTADDRYRYELDSRNRLVRIRDLAGAIVSESAYDAGGNRLVKTEDGKTTYYLRDSEGRVLTEFERASSTSTPAWTKAYLHAGQQQVGFLRAGSTTVEAPQKVAARVVPAGGNKFNIMVYWKKVPDATYIVYRRTDTTPVTALNATPLSGNWYYYYDGDSLVTDQPYYYSVQAVDRYGVRSSPSSEFRIVFKDSYATAPAWSDPWVVVEPGSVTLRWLPSTSPYTVGYVLSRDGGVLNESIFCPGGTCYFPTVGSEYIDSESPGGVYNVCALGSNGIYSNTITYCTSQQTVDYTPPTPPQPSPELVQAPLNFRAAAHPQEATRIDLSWSPLSPESVSRYEVLNETATGFQPVVTGISPDTSSFTLTAPGIQANTLYRLRLRAYDTQGGESPLSEIAEARTRSLTLGVPQFRIRSAVCDPNDDDPNAPLLCAQHNDAMRGKVLRLRIEDTVSRNGDSTSRFGFRLYFRPCARSGQCGEWKTGVEASHKVEPYWDALGSEPSFEGSLWGIDSSAPHDPSLAGIFTLDLEQSNISTGEWLLEPFNAASEYCANGVNGSQYVCAPYYWKAGHGCEIGEYAVSTVRGHLDGNQYQIDEESVASAPVRYDPYELFRNLTIYNKDLPDGQRYQPRLRAFTPCNVRVVGIGMDGHLKGDGALDECGDEFDRIIGYRIYWMPLPYCGIKGYNVYKIPNCYAGPSSPNTDCRKGPLGQLSYDDPNAADDLSRIVDPANKLNTELVTGYHFDYLPQIDAAGYFTGTSSSLPSYITVEALLDLPTLPSGYDPNVNWRDRFSCPRIAAGLPVYDPSPGKYYLTCGAITNTFSDNGTCWCENGNVQGSGGCYRADYFTNSSGWVGSDCQMDPTYLYGIKDAEGYQYQQEIWARLDEEPGSDRPPRIHGGSWEGLLMANGGASRAGGLACQGPDPAVPSELGSPASIGEHRIAGIAEAIEERALAEGSVPEPLENSPYQAVGSIPIPLNEVTYYHTDHLGSVRLTTDRRGYKVRETVYWPFGDESMPVSSDPNTHRFTGHERDVETGLDYMFARYYSAGLSRFLSVDPAQDGATEEDPQSWNRYSYTLNNPLKYSDPNGESPTLVTAAGGFVAGASIRGGWELGKQLYAGNGVDWQKVGAKALSGGIEGAVAGATAGLGLISFMGANTATTVGAGILERGVDGDSSSSALDLGEMGEDVAAGAVGSLGGKLFQGFATGDWKTVAIGTRGLGEWEKEAAQSAVKTGMSVTKTAVTTATKAMGGKKSSSKSSTKNFQKPRQGSGPGQIKFKPSSGCMAGC